jgi:hypothetical protein
MHSLVRTSRADLPVRTSRACLLSHACLFSHEPAKRRRNGGRLFKPAMLKTGVFILLLPQEDHRTKNMVPKKKNMFGGLPERRLRSGARRVCRTRRVRETRTR